MAERYYDNSPRKHELESKDIFVNTIEKFMNRYDYESEPKEVLEQEVDEIISKQILLHLKEFFKRGVIITKTRKNIRSRHTNKGTRKHNPK